jgi:hypothetical protein
MMSRTWHHFSTLVTACTIITSPVNAQRALRPTAAQDSAITQLVATTLLAQLAYQVGEAGLRDSTVPWTIHVPADSGALQWSRIAKTVSRALNARERRATDNSFYVVSVDEYRFTRDSVALNYFIGYQSRCREKFTGGGTEYRAEMRWTLRPTPQVPIPSKEVEYSHSGACKRDSATRVQGVVQGVRVVEGI